MICVTYTSYFDNLFMPLCTCIFVIHVFVITNHTFVTNNIYNMPLCTCIFVIHVFVITNHTFVTNNIYNISDLFTTLCICYASPLWLTVYIMLVIYSYLYVYLLPVC
jgi:hypothetical protein